MKIVADENIPLIAELFSNWGTVRLLSGRKIQSQDVRDADILLVRSVTSVGKNLLQNSKVKFVGSATAGLEHIDNAWLSANNIHLVDAKGANAQAVADYVVACIARLSKDQQLKGLRAGVVGVGNVGSKVVKQLKLLGFDVLQNDPPRAENEKNFISTALNEFTDLDLICLHTPLIKTGAHPTYHLVNEDFLRQLKPGAVLLNAGRGAVIDFTALKKFAAKLTLCLDVWEHEPNINLEILQQATLATPHIAGYSFEAKLQGALMLYQAAAKFFQRPTVALEKFLPQINSVTHFNKAWEDAVLTVYDPAKDTAQMKAVLLAAKDIAQAFDELRKHYPRRHELAEIMGKF